MENTQPHVNRVFIADDSASMRERLVSMLDNIDGIRVVGEAETPAAAVEGILSTRPDSVVLDIHLRGGNGLEVLRNVRAALPEAVFFVLTNYPSPQYRKAFLAAGAQYFLDKNTDIGTLVSTISGDHAPSFHHDPLH